MTVGPDSADVAPNLAMHVEIGRNRSNIDRNRPILVAIDSGPNLAVGKPQIGANAAKFGRDLQMLPQLYSLKVCQI